MPKYYVCEADNADEGVSKVTPCDTAEEALDLAQNSTADVHFVSTINPLSDEETNNDE
jgi:hypothetical protein